MKPLFKKITNKYVLAIIGFAIMILFVGQNDLFKQRQRQKELKELTENIEFLKKETHRMKLQIEALERDSDYLEKYARENYHEKKEDEDVYILKNKKANPEPATTATK